MTTVNIFLTAILVAVVVFILFKPGNKTQEIIGSLGSGSRNIIATLSGQYKGSGY